MDNEINVRVEALKNKDNLRAVRQEFNYFKHELNKEKLELIRHKFLIENDIMMKCVVNESLAKQIRDLVNCKFI